MTQKTIIKKHDIAIVSNGNDDYISLIDMVHS